MEHSSPSFSRLPGRQSSIVHYDTGNDLSITGSHDTAFLPIKPKTLTFYDYLYFLEVLFTESPFAGERQVVRVARVGATPSL